MAELQAQQPVGAPTHHLPAGAIAPFPYISERETTAATGAFWGQSWCNGRPDGKQLTLRLPTDKRAKVRVRFAADHPMEVQRDAVQEMEAIELSTELKRSIFETNPRRVFKL
jgi:hypothetical protein